MNTPDSKLQIPDSSTPDSRLKDSKLIKVLGKTFDTEEDRRNYFREVLRKKLPELKQMEGFPIGEDEDILNLSDPPYYTACPNPWLNDFIAEWEEEKKELVKKGLRSDEFEVDEPYAADVSEGKYHPVYRKHPYHTKVPHISIMKYILHYTQPGDLILDSYAGTGMTSLASKMCGVADLETKHKIESSFDSVYPLKWGKRNAISIDLSTAASFISNVYNANISLNDFKKETDKILDDIEKKLGWMYKTKHTAKQYGIINYMAWSDVFICNNCQSEIVFWDSAVNETTGQIKTEFPCLKCGTLHIKRNTQRGWTTSFDNITGESFKESKRVPVLVNYSYNNKKFSKKPDEEDLSLIEKIQNEPLDKWVPIDKIPKGDKTGEPLRLGITKVHQFYFKRALHVLSNYISLSESPIIKSLLTIVAFRITKRYGLTYQSGIWGAGGGPTNGTLYIPSLIKELNMFQMLRQAQKKFIKSSTLVNDNRLISTQSANNINIPDNSIDYIFIDPPFGSNLNYSELNLIWEAWLKVKTNIITEAIENKTQNKGIIQYQYLIGKGFSEAYRILKPSKWITIEFSNTSAIIWNTIQTALVNSGFIVANVSALDKKKGSFNAQSNPTSVKQDLVISCYKPSSEFDQKFKQHQNTDVAVWDFVEEHLNHLPIHLVKENATTAIIERSPKILFDRLIAFYVQKGLPVPIDAGAFQKGLRERFIERDGMFFTNEQVQEYDKKKAENPEFIQLSLIPINEKETIYWLRQKLVDSKLTESDIHPFWMREVESNRRKGDVYPELRTVLEENFLKDEQGKWYVPDPENEADLEKLRTKRLLKQFEVYKTEAAKPKGKIKEVRVEALRAGFKQSYQDKDFKTIVKIGDRIPNNLLMEDEVLLQFYDIASSRV